MLRIVPHTVPRVGRSYEHFPDGFELHLLPLTLNLVQVLAINVDRQASLVDLLFFFDTPEHKIQSCKSL